jgi:hypothetical protein
MEIHGKGNGGVGVKDETNYERGYRDGKRDVLEKIRAEIEDLDPEYNFEGYYQGQVEVLQIIDKYKAEGE